MRREEFPHAHGHFRMLGVAEGNAVEQQRAEPVAGDFGRPQEFAAARQAHACGYASPWLKPVDLNSLR